MKKYTRITVCILTNEAGTQVGFVKGNSQYDMIEDSQIYELRRHESVNKWTVYYKNSNNDEFQITCDAIVFYENMSQSQKAG